MHSRLHFHLQFPYFCSTISTGTPLAWLLSTVFMGNCLRKYAQDPNQPVGNAQSSKGLSLNSFFIDTKINFMIWILTMIFYILKFICMIALTFKVLSMGYKTLGLRRILQLFWKVIFFSPLVGSECLWLSLDAAFLVNSIYVTFRVLWWWKAYENEKHLPHERNTSICLKNKHTLIHILIEFLFQF